MVGDTFTHMGIMGNQHSSNFKTSKLFSKFQYGFRSGHSTEYIALDLVDQIITYMDNNQLELVCTVFRCVGRRKTSDFPESNQP